LPEVPALQHSLSTDIDNGDDYDTDIDLNGNTFSKLPLTI